MGVCAPSYNQDEVLILENTETGYMSIYESLNTLKKSPYVRKAIIECLRRVPGYNSVRPNRDDYNLEYFKDCHKDEAYQARYAEYFRAFKQYDEAKKKLWDDNKHRPIGELLNGSPYRLRRVRIRE